MSEFDKNLRKKKVFASPREKEFTPRKPVILTKNDRETREGKESKEGEPSKAPVIMIKPRETKEPKEAKETKEADLRAASPKRADAETTPMPLLKIAQNEKKLSAESKTSGAPITPVTPCPPGPLVPPAAPMPRPLKLIDDYLDFSQASAEHLQESNSNFLVVGVVGGQSVGKSTIMNILAHSSDLSKLRNEILNSHQIAEDNFNDEDDHSEYDGDIKIVTNSNYKSDRKKRPLIFKCQDMNQIETGQACTVGVDMYITDSRIILLDTGPVYGAGGNRVIGNSTYNSLPRGGLEISAFLLAVCHVVILVQDWFVDLNMLRFIQSAEMVKPSIAAASSHNQTLNHMPSSGITNQENDENISKDYYPHLIFVQNKCSMDDFNPSIVKLMQELYIKSFCKSNLNIHSGMYMYNPDSDNNIHQLFHNLNVENCGKPINLFLIPTILDDDEESLTYRGHPTIEELGHRLRSLIFGAARIQLTNVNLNEKTWLQYANKTWENIKKSTFFNEYNRLLP